MSRQDLDSLRVLAELGRHREAEQGLRTLLAGDPGNAEAILMLADVLDDQGRHDEAVELAERGVSLEPDDERAHRLLSHVLRGAGRHEASVSAAREAVRLAPYHFATHLTLGIALREGRRPRFRDALECANEAVRLAPHVAQAHNLAGMCLDDLGQPDDAMRAYSEALRLAPHDASVLNNIAALQADHGRLREASAYLTAGLSQDAQERMLHQNLDLVLYRLMRRLFWTGAGFGVLIGILAGTGAPWALRALAGLVMVVVFVLVARGVLDQLPRGAERHALGLFRRTRGWMRYGVVIFAILTVGVLAMAFAPTQAAAAIGVGLLMLFRTLGLVFLVVLGVSGLVSLVRRR